MMECRTAVDLQQWTKTYMSKLKGSQGQLPGVQALQCYILLYCSSVLMVQGKTPTLQLLSGNLVLISV